MAYTITGPESSDVERIRPLVDSAIATTVSEFSDLGAGALLSPSSVSFVLVARPPAGFGLDYAQAITSAAAGRVQLLTPSSHRDLGPDGFSRTYDRVWYQRNLIHECTSVFLWLFDARKGRGWRLTGAPDWFVEGVQEYVAVERGSAEARNRYQAKYLPRLQQDTVSTDFAHVVDKYADGYLVLRFMHDDFGARAVHQLMASPLSTFWGAVEASFGSHRTGVFTRWLGWRTTNAP